MRKYAFLIIGIILLLSMSSYAQAMWPTFLLKAKIQALFSYWLIFLTIIVETIILRFLMPTQSFAKIAVTVIFMNQASAMVNMGILLGVDAALAFVQHEFMNYVVGTKTPSYGLELFLNVAYMAVIYLTTVFVNAVVEWAIAHMYFAEVNAKKLFWTLVIINAISTAIAMFGLLGYEYWFGTVKTRPSYRGIPTV